MELPLLILLALGFPLLVGAAFFKVFRERRSRGESQEHEIDHAELEAAERALRASGEQDWIVLKRCHGPAYNHSTMTDLVGAFHAEGIEATFDVIGTSSADGGVTNYMLKVLREDEERALALLVTLEG